MDKINSNYKYNDKGFLEFFIYICFLFSECLSNSFFFLFIIYFIEKGNKRILFTVLCSLNIDIYL